MVDDSMIFSTKRIEEMSRDQINNLVNVSDVSSGKKLTETLMKARAAAYQADGAGTSKRDSAAVSAVIRAIRRDGPMETYKVAAAMAAVESAIYAEVAAESLTDAEYAALVRPLARALGEPEKRPQAVLGVPLEPYEEEKPAEPTQDELEAFFGQAPDPQLTHEWEKAIEGKPEAYPVQEEPSIEQQIAATFSEPIPVAVAEADEEFDLFS